MDGGSPVTRYLVERSDATRGGAGWATVGHLDASTYSFRAPKLLEGNRYHFRVTAENAVGTGQPIETTHAVEVKSPFGQLMFNFAQLNVWCAYGDINILKFFNFYLYIL